MECIIDSLENWFKLKDIGRSSFFFFSDNGIHLSHSKYIRDHLIKFGFTHLKQSKTSIFKKSLIYTELRDPISDPKTYRSAVGNLQYLVITRPDIAFAVNKVNQFMTIRHETH